MRVTKQVFAAWWRELITLTVLNILWLGLQLLIVTAAPATAAYYVVAQSVIAGDSASWDEFWSGFRQYFWKANRWGMLQALIYFVGLFNFFYYAEAGGLLWGLIKIVWGSALVLWTILQLLYWPLLLEAEDQSIRNTLRNALVTLLLNPIGVLNLTLLTLAIVVVSFFTTMPVGLVMMALIALFGTATIQNSLQASRQNNRKRGK